jgi:hypothetical protein
MASPAKAFAKLVAASKFPSLIAEVEYLIT